MRVDKVPVAEPHKKKLLFISHNATRTGAPLLLLAFISWLRKSSQVEIAVLFRESGELVEEFAILTKVYIWPPATAPRSRFANALARFRLRSQIIREKFSFVYSNTSVNGEILSWLRGFFTGPIVTHVHELRHTVECFGEKNWRQVVSCSNRFVASSPAVVRFLQSAGIGAENIVLNPYFADMHGPVKPGAPQQRKEVLTIGAAGTIEWRKGADLFLQLAAMIRRRAPKLAVRFLWVGGPTYGPDWERVAFDRRKLLLEKAVHFTGYERNPSRFYSEMDVFTLTSREEPFGIVALEAAMAGVPTVCFRDAGGMEDFVRGGAGVAVPYLDLEKMADEIIALARSPKRRQGIVQVAQKKIANSHMLEQFVARFLQLLEKLARKEPNE